MAGPPQERWAEVERLLDQALELAPEERPAFIARACGGDRELQAEVGRLLRAAAGADGFLHEPAPAYAAPLLAHMAEREALAPGTRLGGYEVVRELGHGGMATVYLARDLKHARQVALKVLPPELALAVRTERFLREIEIAARLTHPNILPVFDSGSADGVLYYVTPYIEGESLRDWLERAGPLPLPEALRIAGEVAGALDYAHRHGVVHRDIKPANILFADGHAVVADFGIARAITVAETEPITETGSSPGTPSYMSPEQAGGSAVLDGRSDIYSLGCVLYEMLTGAPPFTGPNAQAVLAKHLTEAAPVVSARRGDVPATVGLALSTALAKQPAERFATAAEFAGAFGGEHIRRRRPRRLRRRILTLVAGMGVLAIAAVATRRWLYPPAIPSVAVLPFVNLSGDTANEYFSDGMTEELIRALSRIEGLRVPARTSSFAFKGKTGDIRDIGRQLNVAFVLEGSVQSAGAQLRVAAQLIKVADGYPVWSDQYDRDLTDVFAIQDEVSGAIVSALKVKLATPAPRRPQNLEAYQLYLKGRLFWNRGTEEGVNRARDFFNAAITEDSGYARAYAGLAEAYTWLLVYRYLPRTEAYPKARAAAERAVALDPSLAEAYSARGLIRRNDWEWAGAEEDVRRAVALDPGYALGHLWYATFLIQQGRPAPAIREARLAGELDPLSAWVLLQSGEVLLYARQDGRALEHVRKALELEPSPAAHQRLGEVYLRQNRFVEAIGEYQAALSLLRGRGRASAVEAQLAYTYARAGRRREALAILDDLKARVARDDRITSPVHLAIVYAGLGDNDQAFAWLARAYQEHEMVLNNMRVYPFFDPLRSDPRFDELVRKVGL